MTDTKLPSRVHAKLVEKVVKAINNATHLLRVLAKSPIEQIFKDAKVSKALADAVQRGVNVRVVIGNSTSSGALILSEILSKNQLRIRPSSIESTWPFLLVRNRDHTVAIDKKGKKERRFVKATLWSPQASEYLHDKIFKLNWDNGLTIGEEVKPA